MENPSLSPPHMYPLLPPSLPTHIKMSNVCNAVQPVEEYIIPLVHVAVMNVWDELAAQSPRKVHRPERGRDTQIERQKHGERERGKEEHLERFDFF